MTSPMMEHIPLQSAYLCQDCEAVGNCATHCPACASTALMSLSAVLNRDESVPMQAAMALVYREPMAA